MWKASGTLSKYFAIKHWLGSGTSNSKGKDSADL